ncbi:MAG: hypothetical protein Q8R07_00115, partial [Candidatus Uhrbacteria bacterium]|nr:hypothetical protein [Candidatus Uhrbacteria bacterium]
KILTALAIVLLGGSTAFAQFTTCGQAFNYPGPTQVTVTMMNNVSCLASGSVGVYLGNYVKLALNGKTLDGNNAGGSIGIRIAGSTVNVAGPGIVSGFSSGVRALSGNSIQMTSFTTRLSGQTGIYTAAASSTIMSGVTVRDTLSTTANGIYCGGPCTVLGAIVSNHDADGIQCNANCGVYLTAISNTGSQDIQVNAGYGLYEYRSCPHDINTVFGATTTLSELTSCSSINCLGSGTYQGDTWACN